MSASSHWGIILCRSRLRRQEDRREIALSILAHEEPENTPAEEWSNTWECPWCYGPPGKEKKCDCWKDNYQGAYRD